MCNAAINRLIIIALAIASLTACSQSGSSSAEGLLAEAQSAYDAHNYQLALELTDSLNRAFPQASAERRAAMHLHAQAMEGWLNAEIAATDSALITLQARGDELTKSLKFVQQPLEGYYIMQGTATDLATTNPLQSRLDTSRRFIMVAMAPAGCQCTSVIVTAGDVTVSTAPITYDGEACQRTPGGEIIYLTGTDADTLGRAIADHPGAAVSVTFSGADTRTVDLTPAQAQAIALTYDYVRTSREMQLATLRREKLEQQLTVARNQVARTMPD